MARLLHMNKVDGPLFKIHFEEMTKLDNLYVTNWSLSGDLKILCQTVPVILGRRCAY